MVDLIDSTLPFGEWIRVDLLDTIFYHLGNESWKVYKTQYVIDMHFALFCAQEMFGNVLPVRQQGFHSVIEFVSAMPHIVHIVRPYENGDWLLSDATARRGEPEGTSTMILHFVFPSFPSAASLT